MGRILTFDRVSKCSQSPEPVGKMPMDEHLYSPSASLKELSTFANSVEMMFYTHTRP